MNMERTGRNIDNRATRVTAATFGILVGGGFAPVFLTVLAGATAIAIRRPLRFWRRLFPAAQRRLLAGFWPGSLVALIVLFLAAVEIAIFGYPLLWLFDAETTFAIQYILGYIMLGLMLLSILSSLAFDVGRHSEGRR